MPEDEETPTEPKQCPKGHGPMRLRVRWTDANVSGGGRRRGRAQPMREWVCPVCRRTVPVD